MRALTLCGVCLVSLALLLAQAHGLPSASEAGVGQAAQSFVRFEQNRGQVSQEADFIARASGYTLFLSGGDAVFAVAGARDARGARELSYLTMEFSGARSASPPLPERELPSRSHYLSGPARAGWHTNVRHFERVRYRDIYQGIDMLYRGGSGLEYDLIVAPHADPSQIRFRLTGATTLHAGDAGTLVATLATGRLVLQPPSIYQEIAGVRQPVAGRFRLLDSSEIQFELAEYDRSQELTIDPVVIVYSSYVGGADSEAATDIAVDAQGMAYLTGQTFSADFPTKGAFRGAQSSGEDAFVLKVNPAASGAASLIYATYLGSTARDGGEGIAVDQNGQAFVTGWTHAGDFPIPPGGFKPTWTPSPSPNDDESDAFAVILNAAGDDLVYGTFFGGGRDEEGMGIAPHGADEFYLAGGTDGGTFPTSASAFDPTGQVRSAFLSVLDWKNNTLLYSTVFHAASNVQLQTRGLAVDGSGRAHITGLARGAGLPVVNAFMDTFPPDASSSFGKLGSFLAVFDPSQSGSASLVYASYLGAGDVEDVAVDTNGRSVVAGTTSSATFPTTAGAFDTLCDDFTSSGGSNLGCLADAFVMLFDPSLAGAASLVAASRLGGARVEAGNGVALDSDNNILVTGSTNSSGFPALEAIPGPTAHPDGETDAFVTKLSPALDSLLFSTRFGGVTLSNGMLGASDVGRAIAVSPDGGACIAGTTSASDFPISRGFDSSLGGFGDAFVAKLVLERKTACLEVAVTRVPGMRFHWDFPVEICVLWDGTPGAPGTFPERCPPPECPACGPGLGTPGGPRAMPPALSRIYREAAAVLAGGVGRSRKSPRVGPSHEPLVRAIEAVPNGRHFSPAMRSELIRDLRRRDRGASGRRTLRRELTAALNALELDWRTSAAPAVRSGADTSRSAEVGGLGSAKLTRGEAELGIELHSGLPALPRGLHTAWPLASYRVTSSSEQPKGATAQVELFVGWMHFRAGGETRLMSWNGKDYRDVTSGYDAQRGLLHGTAGINDFLVVVRTQLCYGRFVPIKSP